MEEMNGGIADAVDAPSQALEDMVPKERVTHLIKTEKDAAYRKAQREFQAQMEQMKTGQSQGMGGMQQVDPDAISNKVLQQLEAKIQEAQQQSQKQDYERYVGDQVKTYLDKMDKGSGLADDFKEMTAKFKPEKFKEVFYLANSFENTPALIYELAKNPYKLANIDYLAKSDPDLARDQLQAIAKSIEANDKAKQGNASAEPPLSRPKHSLAAGTDSGAMSLTDLKKAPWLRG